MIKKIKNTVPWNMLPVIFTEEFVGTYYEEGLQKTNQTKKSRESNQEEK